MSDSFSGYADSAGAPARRVAVVVPSDSIDLPDTPKGLYVGTGGDITLIAVGAPTGAAGVLFRNIPSGSLLPVRTRRVTATGTTASDIVALI